jgi:hypothetical protein
LEQGQVSGCCECGKYAETAENFVIISAIYGFASLNLFLENFSLAYLYMGVLYITIVRAFIYTPLAPLCMFVCFSDSTPLVSYLLQVTSFLPLSSEDF